MEPKTVVEILNNDLEKIAEVRALYPLNEAGTVLRYSKELSDYGECRFRVATKDPFLTQFGDILIPHAYHIRIKRGGTTVWSGAIIDNPERNKNYVEVRGAEYDFYLDKVLIRRDAESVAGDGKNNYRTFNSGTMKTNVTTLMNNAKTDWGSDHPLSGLVVSSSNIENPDYPQGFVNASGSPLTGGWTFSSFVLLQFDYHTVYYVLKAFGVYANCDFEIDENLNFYFKKFIGTKRLGVTFEYGPRGNVVDYDSPRLGKRMVNDVWGIAADNAGRVLHINQRDENSIQTYGLLQGADAYADVKDKNFLKTRVKEGLQFTKSPDESPVNVVLDEKGYPLGQYNIGDIVTVRIKDHVINFDQPRRVVGITVNLHNTGRELVNVQTNKPKPGDLAA